MLGVFDEAADRIEIITRPPENYKNETGRLRAAECIEYMRELGLNVSLKSMFHQKFAVIDGRIVWYGSINFLSYGASEENVMRFRSAQVASELIDTIR